MEREYYGDDWIFWVVAPEHQVDWINPIYTVLRGMNFAEATKYAKENKLDLFVVSGEYVYKDGENLVFDIKKHTMLNYDEERSII